MSTDNGVFLVHGAANSPDAPARDAGYLAYWKDFAVEQLFVYGRPLHAVSDVAEAVGAIERDLGYDVSAIVAARPDLTAAGGTLPQQPVDDTTWSIATRNGLLGLMRFPVPTEADLPDVAFACPPVHVTSPPTSPRGPYDPRAPLQALEADPYLAPVQSPEDLFRWLEGYVACGGCGSCAGIACPSTGNPCARKVCQCGLCRLVFNNGAPCASDGNPCSDDVCQGGICTHPPADGAPCADDGNWCTDDVCWNYICTHPPANGQPCTDDGESCTYDYCQNGVCTHPPFGYSCDDGNPCTSDYCIDNIEHPCGHAPITGPTCDDGNPCTEDDHCVMGSCFGSPNCDDGDSCTNDFCDGSCQHTPKNCDDGNLCTVELGCVPGQGCQYEPVDCDDGNPCTSEGPCDPGLGCQYTPRNCDDGDPCTPDSCVNGVCVHGHSDCEAAEDPCNPTPVVNFYPQCNNCAVTIAVPSRLWINCDDDDGNGVSDFQQPGPVGGENDVVLASLSWTAGCAQMAGEGQTVKWRIAEGSGNRTYRAYRNPDKTEPVDSLSGYSDWPPPSTVWLEGIALTEACPARFVVWVAVTYPTGGACVYCGYEGQRMTVEGPTLEWERVAPDSPNLDACPNNGGVRIFPDKLSQGDLNATIRQQVKLTAKIDPPAPGVMIYFKVYDVDDPFDQLHGAGAVDPNPATPENEAVIANVSAIDNDTSGTDNRGTEPLALPWSASAPTGADGKASVIFTVSMQPGNNYRAVASTSSTALTQVTQPEADAINARDPLSPGASVRGCFHPLIWSPMLTVWRKLHVETDTMVRPTFEQNTDTMDWGSAAEGPAQTQVRFFVDDPLEFTLETGDDHYRSGIVELQDYDGITIARATILDYESYGDPQKPLDDRVTINLPDCGSGQSGLACLNGVPGGNAILSDDDLASFATFGAKTWGCDDVYSGPVGSLAPPDLSLMTERYAPAYIQPVHDTAASAVQGLVTFVRNVDFGVDDGKVLWDQALAARNLPVSTANFWTAMVVSAWQAEQAEDADPDSEDQFGDGVTKGISTHRENVFTGNTPTTGFESAYTGVCAVFKAVFGETSFAMLEEYTVVHEIGHSFGLDHGDGGAMCALGDCQREPFTSASIKKLREYVSP